MKKVIIYTLPTRSNRRFKLAADKNGKRKGKTKSSDEHVLDAPVMRRSMSGYTVPAYITTTESSEHSDNGSSHSQFNS